MTSPVKVSPESVVSTPAPDRSRSQFVRPADLACLVVDRFQHALAPHPVVGAGPAKRAVGRLGEVDPVARMRIHNEQTRSEDRNSANGSSSSRLHRERSTVRPEPVLYRDWEWAVPAYQPPSPSSPVRRDVVKRLLPIGPVQHEEVAVPRSLHQHLTRLPVEVGIDQHGSLHRVPIVGIMRGRLKGPS